ncbi:retrovirus-related Env polyprotein from transposon gypsy isoform X1 [Drosophila virilis]|uniref:retrovirus-related Env polyprotein from transposon gypsy isoform X1 n=1 Tax=Drosophila virilis TaxID=7244 RepID=UPI00139613FE|nr:uncharacterized protein LOC26531840 isoform X1 [Drosophila virilis]
MITFTILSIMSMTTARVTDYSHADYIPIMDGDILLWDSYGYLRHTTNLTDYRTMTAETMKLTGKFPQSHMRKLLEIDTGHVLDMLSALDVHHRKVRSLDFLGTALKVVAGTPDANDFRKTELTQMQLVTASNRQISINSRMQEKINQLTDTVNRIIKSSKEKQADTGHLFETLSTRNRMIITEIGNLMLTLTLVKINVINPTIIDYSDLMNILTDQITGTPITDILKVSNIKVERKDNVISLIIEFPIISKQCRKITIFPVAHNGSVLQLHDNLVADCDGQMLAVANCSQTATATCCKRSKSISYAQGLHAGGTAHCQTQPSRLASVTIVDDGIIVINDRSAILTYDDCTAMKIDGTNLVTFSSYATVNGTRYFNRKSVQNQFPVVAASPLLNISGHDSILSLSYIHRLSENNLNYMKKVRDSIAVGNTLAISFGIMLLACAVGAGVYWLHRLTIKRRNSRKISKILENLNATENGRSSRGRVVNH